MTAASIGPKAVSGKGRSRQQIALAAAGWAAVAFVFVVLALANPINGDEDLFVAPEAVIPSARIYVDFLFLHMPLQTELARPFAALLPGYGFIAMRVAMALMGAAELGLVYVMQRGLGVERRTAVICTALLACTYSFQFASGAIRNDILCALLTTGAMQLALLALRGRLHAGLAWSLAGLLFGAATTVKISAAFPAAAAGLFLIAEVLQRRISPLALAALVFGGIVGGIPALQAWIAAPEAFVYSVLTYPASGPLYWTLTVGHEAALSPAANVFITVAVLAVGPALGALLALWWAFVQRRRAAFAAAPGAAAAPQPPSLVFLDIQILAGLIAALLPSPTSFQYVMPMLPQLFVRLGPELQRLVGSRDRIDRLAVKLMVVGVVVGCGYGLFVVTLESRKTGAWPAIDVTRQAHWIGDRLRAADINGFVATMSSRAVLDSGYPLDLRFTSGGFLYRSAPLLSAAKLDRLHGIGAQNIAQALDQDAPAAIVVGGSLWDEPLRSFAIAHRYRRETSPFGTYDLYVRVP